MLTSPTPQSRSILLKRSQEPYNNFIRPGTKAQRKITCLLWGAQEYWQAWNGYSGAAGETDLTELHRSWGDKAEK